MQLDDFRYLKVYLVISWWYHIDSMICSSRCKRKKFISQFLFRCSIFSKYFLGGKEATSTY